MLAITAMYRLPLLHTAARELCTHLVAGRPVVSLIDICKATARFRKASGLWPRQARTHQLALSDAPSSASETSSVQWRLETDRMHGGLPADLHECESCACCN